MRIYCDFINTNCNKKERTLIVLSYSFFKYIMLIILLIILVSNAIPKIKFNPSVTAI